MLSEFAMKHSISNKIPNRTLPPRESLEYVNMKRKLPFMLSYGKYLALKNVPECRLLLCIK